MNTDALYRHYAPRFDVGRPHDESPQLVYPTRVEYDGVDWEVEEVDVLGRWLCRHDDYDDTRLEYLDPADLWVPDVYDRRRTFGPRPPRALAQTPLEKMMYLMEDIYLPAIQSQLESESTFLRLIKP